MPVARTAVRPVTSTRGKLNSRPPVIVWPVADPMFRRVEVAVDQDVDSGVGLRPDPLLAARRRVDDGVEDMVDRDRGRLHHRRGRVADNDLRRLVRARAVAREVGHVVDVVERQRLHATGQVDVRSGAVRLAGDRRNGLLQGEPVEDDRVDALLGDQVIEEDDARIRVDDVAGRGRDLARDVGRVRVRADDLDGVDVVVERAVVGRRVGDDQRTRAVDGQGVFIPLAVLARDVAALVVQPRELSIAQPDRVRDVVVAARRIDDPGLNGAERVVVVMPGRQQLRASPGARSTRRVAAPGLCGVADGLDPIPSSEGSLHDARRARCPCLSA